MKSEITRALKVFLKIKKAPTTKKALALEFECHPDTIDNLFNHIREAGYDVICSGYPEYTYVARKSRSKRKRIRIKYATEEERRAARREWHRNYNKMRREAQAKNKIPGRPGRKRLPEEEKRRRQKEYQKKYALENREKILQYHRKAAAIRRKKKPLTEEQKAKQREYYRAWAFRQKAKKMGLL